MTNDDGVRRARAGGAGESSEGGGPEGCVDKRTGRRVIKKHPPLEYHFTYRLRYRPRGKRKWWRGQVSDMQPVEIVEIAAAEAPVVYRIRTTLPGLLRTCEVRSFGGALWWPVYDNDKPLTPTAFMSMAKTNWNRASALLDPMRRTYSYSNAPSLQKFLEVHVPRETDDSQRELQAKQAERDAAAIIFCANRVLVSAGDPIWYAVWDNSDKFDLVVGHSCLDRVYKDGPHGNGFLTGGPDRVQRIACGRESLAFGLGEFSSAMQTIDELGHFSEVCSKIIALTDHVPGTATEFCVKAAAQTLRSLEASDIRALMPRSTWGSSKARSDLTSDIRMLRAFVSHEEALRERHVEFLAEVRKVLDRWSEDAALEALGRET